MNLVDAWCYDEHKRVSILYSDFRVKAKQAIRIGAAAKIMNINPITIERAIEAGNIHEPAKSYTLDNVPQRPQQWFGEHNLLELHDYLMTVHVGRPRKDGRITPSQKLPTRAGIIAKMNNNTTLYLQSDDGTFVPLYEPPKF